MAATSAPGLTAIPGGSDLVEWLRSQRQARGITTPADVNAAASTNAGIPAGAVQSEAPSGGIFGSSAAPAAEAGEGSSALSALGGLGSLVAKYAGPLIAGYQMGKPMADAAQNQTDKWANEAQTGQGPDMGQPAKTLPNISAAPPAKSSPLPPALLALMGQGAQPAGPSSQDSPDRTTSPTVANDTQGAGAQSTNDGGVGPVPAASGSSETPAGPVGSPSDLSSTPANADSPNPSTNADGTAQAAPPSGVTMDQLVKMIASSTVPENAWKPTTVAAPAGSVDALAKVVAPNAAPVRLGQDGNAPGVSGLQRFLAAGSGPFDWHRADAQAVANSQDANKLTDKERLSGQVAGEGVMGANNANTELSKEASAAGGMSPQMKMIMDIMGGSISAGQGMRAKLAEIGAENAGKLAVERAKPEAMALTPEVMQRQAAFKTAEEKPDTFTPEKLLGLMGVKNPTADDLTQVQAMMKSVSAGRQFSPEKYMDAQLLQGVIDKINGRGGFSKGAPVTTGGPAPASGGRPSNAAQLNLNALKH